MGLERGCETAEIIRAGLDEEEVGTRFVDLGYVRSLTKLVIGGRMSADGYGRVVCFLNQLVRVSP